MLGKVHTFSPRWTAAGFLVALPDQTGRCGQDTGGSRGNERPAASLFSSDRRTGSMTRAATFLHMAQPALSCQMQQLEDELGVMPFAGPAIPVARLEAVAFEEADDQIVASDQYQLTHGLNDIGRGAVALSAPALGEGQLAVGAPTQWTMRTISEAASSISATTSWMRVGTMRFLRRASVVGASQTVLQIRGKNAKRSWISKGCGRRRIMHGDLALDLRRVRSSAPQAHSPPAGSRDRRNRIAGKPCRRHSAPLRGRTESIAHLIAPFPGSLGCSGCSGDSPDR